MKLDTLPLVICNIVISSVANGTLRFSTSADAQTNVSPRILVAAAFALNTLSFTFWYSILSSGEELSSTQVIISSSMIVLGVSMGTLIFGEVITPLRCLGVLLALLAVSIVAYAGRTPHVPVQPDETVRATEI
jgi:drug/metabolite transporter (DMT)-like permease